MASASVLKDFLVTLGWQVDDAGFKKALSSISAITKTLQDLGKTDQGTKAAAAALQSFAKHLIEVHHKIEEGNKRSKTSFAEFAKGVAEFAKTASITAGAVAVMIERQTQMFENLFFLSQRTGASVANLLNFGSAANTVGISADAAKSAIDSMALALQLNPGLRGIYRSFGISPDQDPTKMIEQFAATMRGKSVFIQHMWADALGIPWEAVRGLIAPGGLERERASRQERERVSGVVGLTQERSTQLSKDAVRFGEELNKLGFTLARIADVSFMYALPALEFLVKHLQEGLELFGKWNDKFGGLLGDFAIFIGLVTSANIALRALGLVRGAGILSTILRTVLGIGAGTAGGAAAAGTAAAASLGSIAGSLLLMVGRLAAIVTALELLYAAWQAGLGGKDYDPNKEQKEGGLIGRVLSSWGLDDFVKWMTTEHKGIIGGGEPIDFNQQQQQSPRAEGTIPHMAEGGIVPINAHAGEAVLPAGLTRGLLGMISAIQNSSGGAALDSPFSSAKRSAESILNWLGGMFAPKVRVDNWDEMREELMQPAGTPPAGTPTARPGSGSDGRPGSGSDDAPLPSNAFEVISRAEGTFGKSGIDYNMTYGGGHADFSNMTLSQVHDLQTRLLRTRGGSPVGAFQVVQNTLGEAVKALGLDPNTTKFTPDIQKQIASWIYQKQGAGAWSGLTGKPALLQQFNTMTGGGLQATPAGSQGRFSASRNLGTINTALINSMRAAANLMPEGFSVVATSGHDTSGHAANSQHYSGNALDVKIFGPQGAIPNRGGNDATGMYARLAHLWYTQLAKNFPGIANKAEWGGEFNDVMHYDLGGRRGRNQRNDWHYLDMNAPITNTFNISSPHPEAAGRAVEDTQKRVSAIHTHNLRTAIA